MHIIFDTGALNQAAEQFSKAYDENKTPQEFVVEMKKKNEYIMGIGHRVKSLENPDSRVTIVKDFVRTQFPKSPLFGIVHHMFSRILNLRICEKKSRNFPCFVFLRGRSFQLRSK